MQVATLFDMRPQCWQCRDTGIWITPTGMASQCPRRQTGVPHNEPNDAARMLQRAVTRLTARRIVVNPHLFAIARDLTESTSLRPCERDRLIQKHFSYSSSQLRHFHRAVEELRRIWLLPVGSRKDPPAGYWIITTLEDFKAWFERSKSAPITQLTTIHRVAKRNFPIFAEQMELEFWNDFKDDDPSEPGAIATGLPNDED